MTDITLNDLFSEFLEKGIFYYLNEHSVPWKNTIDADLLDLDFHSMHGDKIISKTVFNLLNDKSLSEANKKKLAKLIYTKNSVKWDKLWSVYGLYDEFNVLDNTDWTETTTTKHTGKDTTTDNFGATESNFEKGQQTNSSSVGQQTLTEGAQTNIQGEQTSTSGSQTNTREDKISAFNSTTYQPDASSTDNMGQKVDTLGQRSDTFGEKITTTGSRSDGDVEGQRNDKTTTNAYENTSEIEYGSTDETTISRHGNIGVTTSGQLIEDFRKLVDWTMFDKVFEDICDILVLDIFGIEKINIS